MAAGAPAAAAPLQWGDAPTDNDLSALAGGVDIAIGSDICYEEACVGPLAALLERLAAPLTLLIGPVGRSSYALLRQRLKASSMLRTEERLLSLVCNNADDHQPATVHSAGVHSLLIVRRDDGARGPFKDGGGSPLAQQAAGRGEEDGLGREARLGGLVDLLQLRERVRHRVLRVRARRCGLAQRRVESAA